MMDIYAEINKADPAIVERLATALELRAANPRQKQMLNQYLRQIVFPPGASVLEVGCGTGPVSRHLANWPDVGEVIGLDPSPTFLAKARTLGNGQTNLRYKEGDGRNLPFPDESFDVVVCHTVLCHVPGPRQVLDEALRVLRSGGWLAVFDGDYATTTVAIKDDDPLQVCAIKAVERLVLDRWLMRRLPQLVRAAGFTKQQFTSYSYTETDNPDYMLTIIDRGTDFLVIDGQISESEAALLKAEALARVDGGTFFGHIAFGSVVARKP